MLAILPSKTTITRGASVTWALNGPEPHTLTFTAPDQKPPAPDAPDAARAIGSPGPYDGTTTVSSGLQPLGPQPAEFSLTFTRPGTFNYVCTIHPQMTGTIEVVDGDAEPAQDITSRGATERDRFLAEGRDAKQRFLQTPARTSQNHDGSTTHTVRMGTSTPHTEILAFQPVQASIKAGDRVVFLNESAAPHTATFAGTKTLPSNPESPEAMNPAPGRSPRRLNATDLFNTGWLPPNVPPGQGPPEAARSFTFIVLQPGTYAYVCLLHAPSRMTGTIVAA